MGIHTNYLKIATRILYNDERRFAPILHPRSSVSPRQGEGNPRRSTVQPETLPGRDYGTLSSHGAVFSVHDVLISSPRRTLRISKFFPKLINIASPRFNRRK